MSTELTRLLQQGVAQHQGGQLEAARASYEAVLRLEPRQPDALHLLGVVHDQLGDHARAVELIRAALALAPDQAAFENNLATALLALDRLDEAEAACRRAAALDPADAEIRYNLANLLRRRGDAPGARAAFEAVLAASPGHLQARNNLAMLLWEDLDDTQAAAAQFARLRQLAPDWPVARMNAGLLRLADGDFAAGWADYEWRWRNPEYGERDWGLGLPRWTGDAMNGAGLLLWGEQGAGDQILYGTMIDDARQKSGAAITVAVEPRLVALFARTLAPRGCRVVARGTPVAAAAQCPFPSLGVWLRRTEADFTGGGAYLAADPARSAEIRARYVAVAAGRQLVGLAWRSANRTIGRDKSVPLPDLMPLLRRPDIQWVNLQYGDSAADLAQLRGQGIRILDDPMIDALADMDGFAAQVAALDSMVSVSATGVHVAGALGVPCRLLLASGRGRLWYWPRQGQGSRWYDSVRVFRQERTGDWTATVAAVMSDFGENS